ncbi:MAG: hypothetical protein HRU00_08075 [Myxococcales bacterium]|nr:hypothetical protein [Myxococcales bacterium]
MAGSTRQPWASGGFALIDAGRHRLRSRLRAETGELARAAIARLSREARCRVPGLELGRAEMILAGLCVLERLLEVADVREFRVSGRGVRSGAALRLLDA